MAYQSITNFTSPNQSSRGGARISSITIHHWGVKGQKFQNVVNYLCRPGGTSSAHYVVEDGRVACIVAPGRRAWHSGNNVGNDTSIGIECRPEATDGDYATVAELVRNLRAVYGDLPLKRHSDWKNTACPGAWDLARIDRLARSSASPVSNPSGGGGQVDAPTAPNVPIQPKAEEADDMGFYFYYSHSDSYYWFNQARGKVRRVTKDEWAFLSAVASGAAPVVPGITLHKVSLQWYQRAVALGTY